MKRVASKEVGERVLVESILCHAHDAPGINSVAQILSSSQSLNVSVQMGLLFIQDLCFQARNSLQNGSWLIQTFGMCFYIFMNAHYVDFTMLKVSQCQRMAGQMTFCARNGLKSLSSLKPLPRTHQESLFYSFMMVMDLMIPSSSLSLLENTTLFSSACHPTPLTNSTP